MHEVDQDVVVMYTLVKKFFIQIFLTIIVYEGYEGVCRVFTLRVYIGYLL